MKRLGLRCLPLIATLAFAPLAIGTIGCGHSDQEWADKQREVQVWSDYTAADCIHTGSLGGPPNHGYHERGAVSWTDSGGNLIITGVALVGGVFPVTITVPDSYGHSVLPSDSVITGFALGTPDRGASGRSG